MFSGGGTLFDSESVSTFLPIGRVYRLAMIKYV